MAQTLKQIKEAFDAQVNFLREGQDSLREDLKQLLSETRTQSLQSTNKIQSLKSNILQHINVTSNALTDLEKKLSKPVSLKSSSPILTSNLRIVLSQS